jgi:hypothetical protein
MGSRATTLLAPIRHDCLTGRAYEDAIGTRGGEVVTLAANVQVVVLVKARLYAFVWVQAQSLKVGTKF